LFGIQRKEFVIEHPSKNGIEKIVIESDYLSATCGMVYSRRRQPMARGTIFNGTLSALKYSNYDFIKNLIFNSIETSDNFIISK
jgi:hypothetical protein